MQLTKDFQQILIDFFTKYDEKNLKTVPDIMKRFRQNKEQVILHLCNKYNVDVNTLEGVDMTAEPKKASAPVAAVGEDGEPLAEGEAPAAAVEGEEGAVAEEGGEEGEAAPKKKSKVMMIIIILVVLGALGGGGFYAYTSGLIPGMGGAHTEEEAPADTEEPAEEAEPEAEPEPEPEPKPELEVPDSVEADSAEIDSAEAGGDTPE